MNIHDFFINAIFAKAHYKRSWVFRMFTVTVENPLSVLAIDPWTIVRTPVGVSVIDSAGNNVELVDAVPNQPLLSPKTIITVPANFYPEWIEGGVTTAGNLLYNAVCLWPTVGSKFGYENGRVSQKAIEKQFAARMVDDPVPGVKKDPSLIYVSDWLRYGQAIKYMEEFTQVFIWSLTTRSVVPSKVVLKRKAELLEIHKTELDNPVVQAKIFQELESLDSKLLEDDPGSTFIGTGKNRLARRKLTIMYGSEQGLNAGEAPKLITQSLHDGLKPENIVDVMNVSRAGSFDRGAETMLGGVEAKWGDRIMSAAKMVTTDCGTKLGFTYTVKLKDVDNTVGRYIMTGESLTLIETAAQAQTLVGKTITVRTPSRCAAGPSTTWCSYCLGAKLAANDKSLALAVSAYGSAFLNLFLKSMHAKASVPVRLNVRALMN